MTTSLEPSSATKSTSEVTVAVLGAIPKRLLLARSRELQTFPVAEIADGILEGQSRI